MTDIHSRAMLAALHVRTWSARKYDRRISEEVNQRHGAADDAGRYNKHLLPGDAPSYREIMAAAGEARRAHYEQTLPWSEEGWVRLLPSANWMEYSESIRRVRARFDSALRVFVGDYPALQRAARVSLNGMYRDDDYPDSDAIESRFAISCEFSPVPASGDFRLDLPEHQVEEIRASTEASVRAATKNAMQDAWGRLYESVERIHERLSDPKGILRDAVIDNARDLVELLGRLNVTEDPGLDRMRATVRDRLTMYGAAVLRDELPVRAEVARHADAILSTMRGIYGGAE